MRWALACLYFVRLEIGKSIGKTFCDNICLTPSTCIGKKQKTHLIIPVETFQQITYPAPQTKKVRKFFLLKTMLILYENSQDKLILPGRHKDVF